MTILVIEDDRKTGDYLKKGLTESGYQVDLVRNGTDGLHQALGAPIRTDRARRDAARHRRLADHVGVARKA